MDGDGAIVRPQISREEELRGGVLILIASTMIGCSQSVRVQGEEAAEVDRYIAQDQSPLSPRVVAVWYARGEPGFLACGEIEAPDALRDKQGTLRFVYDFESRHGQVEFHDLWIDDGVGMALVQTNRMVFNDLWNNHCAEYSPIGRRVAHLVGL